MSDKPISVGDLVMVVRWPCCGDCVGAVARVYDFYQFEPNVSPSPCCGHVHTQLVGSVAARVDTGRQSIWPLAWVKRIPPLEDLDDVKRDEEITA